MAEGSEQLGVEAQLRPNGPDPEGRAQGGPGAASELVVLHDGAQNGMACDIDSTEQPISSGSRVAKT